MSILLFVEPYRISADLATVFSFIEREMSLKLLNFALFIPHFKEKVNPRPSSLS